MNSWPLSEKRFIFDPESDGGKNDLFFKYVFPPTAKKKKRN
jgi:hypothetical protein